MTNTKAIGAAALLGLAAFLASNRATAGVDPSQETYQGAYTAALGMASPDRLTQAQVAAFATRAVSEVGGGVDPRMLRAMAEIESSRKPEAIRTEWHINDSSVGLMQTLLGTAVWLARDMGYTRYGVPTLQDLLQPEVSMYFGAAYVRWLGNYGRKAQSEQWIVESYNGGPNNSNGQTLNHWRKYQAAKAALI